MTDIQLQYKIVQNKLTFDYSLIIYQAFYSDNYKQQDIIEFEVPFKNIPIRLRSALIKDENSYRKNISKYSILTDFLISIYPFGNNYENLDAYKLRYYSFWTNPFRWIVNKVKVLLNNFPTFK